MKSYRTRIRPQGGSLTTVIPVHAARRIGLQAGEHIDWTFDEAGGLRVTRHARPADGGSPPSPRYRIFSRD